MLPSSINITFVFLSVSETNCPMNKQKRANKTQTPQPVLQPAGIPQGDTQFFSLMQSLPFNISVKDAEGRFIFANTSCCQMLNCANEMIPGKRDADFFPEEKAAKYRLEDQQVMDSLEPLSYEEEDLSPQGDRIVRQVLKSPLYDIQPTAFEKRAAIGVLGVSWDITRQRVAEEERKILEKQLAQVQKLEALGIFAGGIAHDFNNVLFLIGGYTDLALNDLKNNLNPTSKLEKIKEASQRASNLVRQIQSFARQTSPERKLLDMRIVVKEAIKLLRSALPSTISIKYQIPSQASLVIADPSEVHQILMNLCANANQAMAGQNGTLTISLEHLEVDSFFAQSRPGLQPGPHLVLTVSDTGRGMSREVQTKIFGPIFSTNRQGEGAGLGLSVLHGIVSDMGGAIAIMSEAGHGSTFQIFLPHAPNEDVPGGDKNPTLTRGNGQHILVIDDESEILEMLTILLEDLNYQAITYVNPQEALKHFNEDPAAYDLVLTDLTMPIMNGMELSQAVLNIRPDIPVILCTGFSQNVEPEDALQTGIRVYLTKPVLQAQLSATLSSIFNAGSIKAETRED
ncbi:MAG: response regulator [Desulfobulbaceae bacterium]|nr:MAG: response regulator [Desulfobulbaceae bacterium]